ncbi:MAG: hypothetical protein JF616_19435 [Fibrobacteres bacterium]|jgi:hypothetical protein|nr:hypothetical protein [Fibrobacterota bacterium]
MIPEVETPTPQSRSARLKILLPIAFVAAGLALFLALFWRGGHGHKGHARSAAAEGDRSPVGGSGDEGNSRVTGGGSGGGSPVGGSPSRSSSGKKGDTWWYHEGKSRKGAPDDAWWSPGKGGDKTGSGRGSPVGASSNGDSRAQRGSPKVASSESSEEQPAQDRNKPAHFSSKNPGEVAGQKGGPDDYWWRN